MRRLLLLRHSKTERAEPGERDRDRKLTERGRADAPVIGDYMVRHHFVPDLALVSPAVRTQETWALVAARSPNRRALRPRTGSTMRVPSRWSELIQEGGAAQTLLVVGHNPGLQDLALQLVGSGDVEYARRH